MCCTPNANSKETTIEVVARIFVELLKNYDFKIVEFALATRNDVQSSAFARAINENKQ